MAKTFPPPRNDGELLTSAVARIADLWGLDSLELGKMLGVAPATVLTLRAGTSTLDPASQSFEAGQLLLRLFRSLDALMGSDDDAARRWLATPNIDLGAKPIDCVASIPGLIAVCEYVDALRVRA